MGSSTCWIFIIVCFAFLFSYTTAQNCAARTSCSSCVVDTNCGWCLADGVARCYSGTASGPTTAGVTCSSWQFSVSQIISTVPGFPVHPSSVDVFLKPGETVNLVVQVTPLESANQKLDLFVVQDASGSMDDDLLTFRTLVPSLVNNILAYRDDSYFGLTSFIDKPLYPAGDTSSSNYVYKRHLSLTNDFNQLLMAVTALGTTGNIDWCEASLDGMAYTIMDPAAGWRVGSKKVMVLATDACYHQADDIWNKRPYSNQKCERPYDNCCFFPPPSKYIGGQCPFKLPPNNMDMVLDIWNGTSPFNLPGTGEDYVSKEQLKTLLVTNNVLPIFAVTDTAGSVDIFELQMFKDLVEFIGFGAVYPLESDSSNLVEAIVTSLELLSRTVTIAVAKDDYNITKFTSPTTLTNVDTTDVVNFNIALNTSSTVVNHTIQLTVLGFGTVFINVYPQLPCKGCNGVVDSDTFYDVCGVCNGTSACLDCSNQPFGSKVVDACGVCGGDGRSCLGCDGVANSGLVVDSCGVCNGANACVGCDGLPSNKVYDLCGVCGGNNSCLDCANVPNGTLKEDLCGVCGGSNSCIGCDNKYTVPPKVLDSCGICGGLDACVDCFGVANGTAVIDKCGVCNGTNSCQSCDGTFDPNNKVVNDTCGVCGGDGKSCAGCDGVPFSGAVIDLCGICGGNNTCVGCDGVPNSGKVKDQCDVCGGDSSSCIGCDNQRSNKTWDRCGICGGNNTCVGCDGVPYSGAAYDVCGVCKGNGLSCIGCDGKVNSSLVFDRCGICGGKDACVGCDEQANSGAVFDRCGECNGNDTCLGCDGVPNSGLEYDLCGVCPNAANYTPNACVGCDNEPFSGSKIDECGVCNGNNTCLGCDEVPHSNLTLDACGICPNAYNYTENACFGCDNKPNSGLTVDRCGVCGGNDTCVGCDNVVNSTTVKDLCGICGGNNSCVGCDGVPNSGIVLDVCGDCAGSLGCLGCDGVAFSNATVDNCGICKGDNSSCKPVPFYLQTRTIAITAGTVGGVMVGAAALIAGLFIYKRLTAGAYWYIPKDLLDSTNSAVIDNPLFEAQGSGFVESPLFDE